MIHNKYILFVIITVILIIIFSLIIGEIVLRLLPFPGLEKKVSRFNNLVGTGFNANATVTYRNKRGDYTKRKVNRWGFLDKEWEENKAPRTYRIGFFGDSFTEARQVQLEQTFFNIIEKNVADTTLECLSFGISEFSTLQSYITSKQYMNKFDLDIVVYVFYENDPGDNLKEIKKLDYIPYADLKNDTLIIDTSFINNNMYRNTLKYKLVDFSLRRSVLLNTLVQRSKLIHKYGIRIKNQSAITSPLQNNTVDIDQNQRPSTWPDSLYQKAQLIAKKIILKWNKEVVESGKVFVILDVPHPDFWYLPLDKQDTWKKFLLDFAIKENINLIDPTSSFWKYHNSGCDLYYDHLTSCGHEALSRAFIDWFHKYINMGNKN